VRALQIKARLDARLSAGIEPFGFDTLLGLDHDRNIERERTPGLHLRECNGEACALHHRLLELELRVPTSLTTDRNRSADRDPTPPRALRIRQRTPAKTVVTIELLQRLDELRIATFSRSMLNTMRSCIADRFGDGVGATLKTRQREVILGRDVVGHPCRMARRCSAPARAARDQMIAR